MRNAIEGSWWFTKSVERRMCDYSIPSLLARLPVTLSTVSLALCRKWSRVSWLYFEAYSLGLEGYLQTRELRKWTTSQRSPTDTADNLLLARSRASTLEERMAKERAALAAAKQARLDSNK